MNIHRASPEAFGDKALRAVVAHTTNAPLGTPTYMGARATFVEPNPARPKAVFTGPLRTSQDRRASPWPLFG